MHLSNGNGKLGMSIWNFNLPLTTCKFRTKMCERICYAKRGHFCYSNVTNHQKKNLRLAESLAMVKKIKEEIEQNRVGFVRIHSSGDFHSQSYFNKWLQIAKQHPLVRFTAYTRNWLINAKELPSNFNLFFSVDSTTKKINPTISRLSFVGHDCAGPVYQCHGSCAECMKCYTGKGNVFFKIH